jgi:uncharacterized membrane protein
MLTTESAQLPAAIIAVEFAAGMTYIGGAIWLNSIVQPGPPGA